jgi:hypothetical protein
MLGCGGWSASACVGMAQAADASAAAMIVFSVKSRSQRPLADCAEHSNTAASS